VASEDPGDHEEAKEDVAEFRVSEVFKAFGNLQSILVKCKWERKIPTHRKKDIYYIHDAED